MTSKRSLTLRVGIASIAVSLLASFNASGSAAANDGADGTSTTTPNHAGSPGEANDEIAQIAKQMGVSEDEASRMVEAQGELSAYAQKVTGDPGFVDFMFTEDHLGAIVLVEPGSNVTRFASPPANVEIRDAVAARSVRDRTSAEVLSAVQNGEADDVVAVTYDAFTNDFTA